MIVIILWSIFCVMIGAIGATIWLWWRLATGRSEVRSLQEVLDDWKGLRS